MAVKTITQVLKNPEKNIAVQDDRIQSITDTRMKRILLNNPNYLLTYDDLEKFLKSKIDFGKYKAGAVQNFIDIFKVTDAVENIKDVKELKNFNWKFKLDDFYEFTGKLIKIKEQRLKSGQKMIANEAIKDIIKNNRTNPAAKYFITGEEWFTWEEVLRKDSAYIGKIVDLFDFSDPSKNKWLFTYYTNRNNIDAYMAGELSPDDIRLPHKNSLSSFEFELGFPSYKKFVEKFKETWFTFIDTETTRLDHVIGSLLSFWYVKVWYDKKQWKFVIQDQWEIFIEDLKEPISEYSSHGWVFGKYSGNKITEKVMKEKWHHPMEAAEKVKQVMEGWILFAHNASFDNGVLNTFFNDLKFGVPVVDKFYDTYSDAFPFFFAAIPKYRDMVKLGLDSIAEKVLWVSVKEDAERHTALKDALWSSEILLKLLEEPEIMWAFTMDDDNEEWDTPLRLF